MSHSSELVTMREAARRLGLVKRGAPRGVQERAAARLRALLVRREHDSGLRVISATESPQSPCVTLSAIRAACPELRTKPSEVDEVKRILARLDERIDERVISYVEPRLARQAETNEVFGAAIRRQHGEAARLERRVEALELARVCTGLHGDRRISVTADAGVGEPPEGSPAPSKPIQLGDANRR